MQDANEQADGATLRERVQRLAPSPRCIADTGLGETLLAELLCKHLLDAGALDLPRMASRLRLPGIVLDEVLNGLRQDGRIEVLGQGQGQTLRYGLTERGREATRDALQRSGYLGPAPFAVDAYRSLLRLQTVHASRVDRQAIREAMRDVVLSDDMLDRLGVALNSNRALMLYGPPGTGKTFIASRLIRLFEEAIWVPHAIAIDDAIVPIYDAQIHRRLEDDATRNNLLLGEGIDRRLACCLRPQLRVGGEHSPRPGGPAVPCAAAAQGGQRPVRDRRPRSPTHAARAAVQSLDRAARRARGLPQPGRRASLQPAVRRAAGVFDQLRPAGSGRRRLPAPDRPQAALRPPRCAGLRAHLAHGVDAPSHRLRPGVAGLCPERALRTQRHAAVAVPPA